MSGFVTAAGPPLAAEDLARILDAVGKRRPSLRRYDGLPSDVLLVRPALPQLGGLAVDPDRVRLRTSFAFTEAKRRTCDQMLLAIQGEVQASRLSIRFEAAAIAPGLPGKVEGEVAYGVVAGTGGGPPPSFVEVLVPGLDRDARRALLDFAIDALDVEGFDLPAEVAAGTTDRFRVALAGGLHPAKVRVQTLMSRDATLPLSGEAEVVFSAAPYEDWRERLSPLADHWRIDLRGSARAGALAARSGTGRVPVAAWTAGAGDLRVEVDLVAAADITRIELVACHDEVKDLVAEAKAAGLEVSAPGT